MNCKRILCTTLIIVFAAWTGWSDDRLNFVFFIADDISVEDLGCYGHPTMQTPSIDSLAETGLRFTNAYLTISSCSPSRCSIITGRYPHNTGAAELHTKLPKGSVLFPKILKNAGYYTVLSGKHHMGGAANPAFTLVSKGKGPGKEEDWVDILKDRPKGKPFFCWYASTDAHRSWQFNDDAPKYDPDDVVVPPYLVDGEKTREDLTGYYHEVSRFDYYVGQVVEELKRQSVLDNTVIIIIADNGRPFPRCKTRLYDSGIKTPMIVHYPKGVKTGVTDSLVSAIDISATVLDLAGVEKDERIQGVTFNPLLADHDAVVRDVAFAEHNWHVYRNHERLVRTGDWLYICNNVPDQQNLCVEAYTGGAGEELWAAHEAGTLTDPQMNVFWNPCPGEELYHVGRDPHQLTNLASFPEHKRTLKTMRKLLKKWTKQTGDNIPENLSPHRDAPPGQPKKDRKDFKHGEMPGDATGAQEINHPGPVRLNKVPQAAAPDKPNVLFLICDDLNCDLGVYGHPQVQSPNIDRLATGGMTFQRAYCQYPLCGPSRASFMTGLYPDQTLIRGNAIRLRERLPNVQSMSQMFINAGYEATRIGKIYHYGVPKDIGTDGHDDQESWTRKINPKGRDKTEEDKVFSLIPGRFGAVLSWLAAEGTDEEQTDGIAATEAIQLLEQYGQSRTPFFMAVGLYRPHTPYVAPKKYFDLYPRDKIVVPTVPAGYLETLPKPVRRSLTNKKVQVDLKDDLARSAIQAYYASITFADAQVGRILDALEETGLEKNTIVVFTSDHGYHMGEHGYYQKTTLFENADRVPLIISAPGMKAKGKQTYSFAEMIDFYPTLAELAGLEAPAYVSGVSQAPVLDDPSAKQRQDALTQYNSGYSLRTERYRYNEWGKDGAQGIELYDHQSDPNEMNNLSDKPEYAETTARLAKRIRARIAEARTAPPGLEQIDARKKN